MPAIKILHSFGGEKDKSDPLAGLMQDATGNLYGTTNSGGPSGLGTVFKVTGSQETVLYSFTGTAGDGANPVAGLVQDAQGYLYGTTLGGGAHSAGTVFKVDPTIPPPGNETVLYSFTGAGDGASPAAGLFLYQGKLYGTTFSGGTNGTGTVFEVDPTIPPPGNETVLHSFTGSTVDGANPYAGLMLYQGSLYGTTYRGGANGVGTIFVVTPTGSLALVLHSFTGTGGFGAYPYGNLVVEAPGVFYGTTYEGGDLSCNGGSGCGTVFTLDFNDHEDVLYTFTGTAGDGALPYAGLIQDPEGNLYGTTTVGGLNGTGTVFKLASQQ